MAGDRKSEGYRLYKGRVYGKGFTPLSELAKAKEKPSQQQEEGADDSLPQDFPLREALTGAGYDTLEEVRGATDDDLLAISGIGDKGLARIRAAQG